MNESQNWFPGADYPDREVWLRIRSTPRNQRRGRVIQNVQKRIVQVWELDAAGKPIEVSRDRQFLMPIVIGINKAKRAARDADLLGTPPMQFGKAHQNIVRQRHAYYRRAKAA